MGVVGDRPTRQSSIQVLHRAQLGFRCRCFSAKYYLLGNFRVVWDGYKVGLGGYQIRLLVSIMG